MVRAKNYETMSTFVKVMQKKLCPFFPDTVYICTVKLRRAKLLIQLISQLWCITCHMGSRCVTFHPTQVNTPGLNPSETDWYSNYLPQRNGRLIYVVGCILR